MKKASALILPVIFLFLVPSARAQTLEERKALAAEADLHREELQNLVQETVRALQWHSTAFFRRVYGEDFYGTAPNGVVLDKAALLAAVQNSPEKYITFVATDIRIRVFQDTAVVTSVWSSRGTLDGRPFSHQSRVIQIFVYGQRGWQVVASQETRLPG
jgi:hypothetical protein